MNQKSVLIYNASQKYPTCALLSDMIGEALFQEPDLLLKSVDYVDLEFDTLVWLLQRDDLSMSEMEIWRHVVQWCLNKLDRKLDTDLKKWNDQDFDEFQKVMGPILPYIRWCQIKKEDFSKQVDDFKKIIPDELYEVKDDTIVPSPTYTKSTTRIPSVLITPKQAAKIASWIDGLDLKSKEFYDARNIPYDFNLIGDNNEISEKGGDNNESNEISENNENNENIENIEDKDIVSRVKNPKEAIYCNVYCSPVFGKGDLFPKGHFEIGQPCGCKQINYDKSIRSSPDQFIIEEFEVFHIVPKSNIKN
nr:7148_t:CDS:2 [Entrophospora candida]